MLNEAAIFGNVDILDGLKENVIVGHLVPAGTGFPAYFSSLVEMPSLLGETENALEEGEELE